MICRCKQCGGIVEKDDEKLWGHIQFYHRETFEELDGLETPDMLDECYDVDVTKVWARIGVSVYLTKEEMEQILADGKEVSEDIELDDEMAQIILATGYVDGDCYIPAGCISPKKRTYYCVVSQVFNDGSLRSHLTATREAEKCPDSTIKELSSRTIYTDWFDSRKEAEDFVKEARSL